MKPTTGHILVVDHELANRLLLETGLKKHGYRVTLAENGRQALERLAAEPFDLVLLDLLMPEGDGFKILAFLKEEPSLKNIPVLIISAAGEMASVVKGIQMGAEDHLPKPFNPALLRARIRAGLQKKRFRERETEYLKHVAQITRAAEAVENQAFDPATLDHIARRRDSLGTLGRVFQRMAHEIISREKQLTKDYEIQAALIDVISHEMRTPFASAAMSLELLEKFAHRQMIDEFQAQVDQLRRELDQGRRMIETMIAYADQVSQEPLVDPQPVPIWPLVREAVMPLQPMAEQRKLRLTLDRPPPLPEVTVDHERFKDVIHHLVHNAIKFTPDGGEIVLKVGQKEGYLVVQVKDNGVGIPAEQLAQIWEPFGQNCDRVRRGAEGLGLGLTLARSIIRAHGGEIAVVSEPGVGSLFYFRLPLQPQAVAA